MEQYLREEDVVHALDRTDREIGTARRLYARGLITDDECLGRTENAVGWLLGEFLPLKGFTYRFSQGGFSCFEEEYRRWQAGSMPADVCGEAWLFSDGFGQLCGDASALEIARRAAVYHADGTKQYTAASGADKALFFRIIHHCGIPTECFRPLPEGMSAPALRWIHTYGNCVKYLIDFRCVKDGGLSADGSPAGKRFCLESEQGLSARVLITKMRLPEEQRRGDLDEDDISPPAKYLAEGTVEGYTSDRVRPLTLRTDATGSIAQIGFTSMADDSEARNRFPLWQEGFRWQAQKQALWNEVYRACIYNIMNLPESF